MTDFRALAQPEPQGPSDEELLELMPETMRDEFSYAAKVCSDATGGQVKPGIFRVCLNHTALEYARAVLARWGRPAIEPVPQQELEASAGIGQSTTPANTSALADSLVERVAIAMRCAPNCDDESWETEARAAIREVAAWLDTKGQHGCSLWLREEANR
jgi:hypothetical protein